MLYKNIKEIETHLWSFSQNLRSLIEFREDNSTGWNDNASNELNSRYFNHHEEDSEKSIQFLQNQIESLAKMHDQFLKIDLLIEEANKLSREIEIDLGYSRADIKKSYHSLEDCINTKNESSIVLNKAKVSLDELNKFYPHLLNVVYHQLQLNMY